MARKPFVPDKKMPKHYDLSDAIRKSKIYKSNIKARDDRARYDIDENCNTANIKSILMGQMIMFDYFEPLTKDELEYYDAMPCTIFFGRLKNKEGKPRVLGWNIHYYPPRLRFLVLARIFEIFKPYYEKSWSNPLSKDIPYVQYGMLLDQLKKAKLDFGVRMYDPKLMDNIRPVPTSLFERAVFSEGRFKKRTRDMIMNYWRQHVTK